MSAVYAGNDWAVCRCAVSGQAAARWCRVTVLLLLLPLLSACQSMRSEPAPSTDAVASARQAGESAYAAGEWATAEPHYRTLVAAIPQDAELWFRLGNIYARTDRPDAAVAAYRESLVRDGDLAKAWFNMGVVQLRQAANSFLKMKVHSPAGDPVAARGAATYEAIMGILGEQALPAADPAQPGAVDERAAP